MSHILYVIDWQPIFPCHGVGVVLVDIEDSLGGASRAFSCCGCDKSLYDHMQTLSRLVQKQHKSLLTSCLLPIIGVDDKKALRLTEYYVDNFQRMRDMCKKYSLDEKELLTIDVLEFFREYI